MMEENNVIEEIVETDSEKIKRLEAQVFQLKNIILKLVKIEYFMTIWWSANKICHFLFLDWSKRR